MQQQQPGSNVSTPGATPRAMATPGASGSLPRNVSVHTPVKTKSSVNARPSPSRSATPKVATSAAQRAASTPVPPHQPAATAAVARVTSNPVAAGGRPVQVNGSAIGNGNHPVEKRGVKRELEVSPMTPGQGNANPQPRPQKKRRMVCVSAIYVDICSLFLGFWHPTATSAAHSSWVMTTISIFLHCLGSSSGRAVSRFFSSFP